MKTSQTRVAILGAGGLGRGMVSVLNQRSGFVCVGMADRSGFLYDSNGIVPTQLENIGTLEEIGVRSSNAIIDLLSQHGTQIDAIFMALPNLPVDFFANTLEAIATQTPFQGVIVDALKRTKAVELLMPLDGMLRSKRILYVTGAGATPGFLTTVASVAAQSFAKVESVNIRFGVGISNWEAYRATIREDFLHLEGFNAERVAAMTDADIEAELDKRNGLIELTEMEHADDIILELAGVCPRDRVTVGGLVDTRNAQKPCQTTVTITGITFGGKLGTHQFLVSNETTMVDNVCGPAFGFMQRGLDLHNRGMYGLMTSADLMPKFGDPLGAAKPQPTTAEKTAATF